MSDAVPIRDASTVVLLRDGSAGLEAWLLTRVTNMVFAAGMSVFPGGRVEETDGTLPMVGDVAAVAARFDCTDAVARAVVGAAVRETFEETGVLLTAPAADLPAARAAVESGALAFGSLLAEHGLAVDADALRPWARWVTPAGEVRRYDTRFFVGALPDAAVARDVTSESSVADWVPVAAALAQAARGERRLLPPTLVTLAAVGEHVTVADVLAAAPRQPLDPVRPTIVTDADGGHTVVLADGRRFRLAP